MSRKRLHRLLLAGVLCMAGAISAHSQNPIRQRILIDGSASMDGFFNKGQIKQLREAIGASLKEGSFDTYYFIDDKVVAQEPAAPNFGSTTLLNNALTEALKKNPAPAIIWIITDNQPSVGSATDSDKDIARFYEQLQSSLVDSIELFPLRLPFDGKLYLHAPDGSEYGVPFNNKRGLLVYAILLDPAAKESFRATVKQFAEQPFSRALAKDFQSISVKPLNYDTVTANLIAGDKLRVVNNQISGGDFAEGEPIRGSFKLELVSRLGQIKIDDASIQVDGADQFETGDFVVGNLAPEIDPTTVANFSPGPHNRKEFVVKLELDSAHMKTDLPTLWKSIRNNRGYIRGKLRIAINVPPQKFSLVPELTQEFSTERDIYQNPSPEVQKRIYKLNDLVNRMIPDENLTVRPQVAGNSEGVIPVNLSVRYPSWPTGLLVALLLLSLLLSVLVATWVKRQPHYRLTWANGQYRACPDFKLWPFMGQPVEINNRKAGTIKKTLSGIRIRAAREHTVDQAAYKSLNPEGTDFNVARRDDGAGVNFTFRKAGRLKEARSSKIKDVFSEVTYGTGAPGATGSSRSENGPLPVRKPTTAPAGKTATAAKPADDKWDLDSLLR